MKNNMTSKARTAMLFSASLLAVVGLQNTGAAQATNIQPVSNTTPSNTPGSGPALEQRYPRYVLQREDTVLLSFPLSPELNQTVTIQPDGYINLQNAGSVYVRGMTVPELVVAVKKAYGGILHDPIVDADLKDFQKPMFTVTGQVAKPGQYELRQDITVAEALAVAGGLTATSKTQILLFHRTSKDWYEVKKVNMKDILNGKNQREDAMMQPGDMLVVPEKFITNFRKYVPYSLGTGGYVNSY